jgi:hypothetical protein
MTALTIVMKTILLRRSLLLMILALSASLFGACDSTTPVQPPASPSPSSSATPAVSPTSSPAGVATGSKADSLVGKWAGPEGTSLNVTKKNGDKYSVEVTNLDGTKTYEGAAKGDIIEFTRNGKAETIKSATGAETGMKGFEKEANCVVITKGSEGFCKR